jgi:hypothetical protein
MGQQRRDQDDHAEHGEDPDERQEPDHDLTPMIVVRQPG